MYLKLGRQNLQYYRDTSDWMIMAEVIDSSLSFETPILVRNTDELDIWFGRNFPDYIYMKELIDNGIVLLLYKPILTETTGTEGYIDLSVYIELRNVWLRNTELNWISKVLDNPFIWKFYYEDKVVGFKSGSRNKISGLTEEVENRDFCTLDPVREELPDQIKEIYNTEKPKFHVYDSSDFWIFNEGEILDIEYLPQNINNTSISSDNRDTLVISNPEDTNINFSYLDYRTGELNLGIYKDKYLVDQSPRLLEEYLNQIDSEKVATGGQSTVFSFIGEGDNSKDYIVIPSVTDPRKFYLLYGNRDEVPVEVWEKFYNNSKQINFSEISNEFVQLGYKVVFYNNKIYTYSDKILPVLWFYKSNTFIYSPETNITEKIISCYMKKGLEVMSKTIGRSSEYEDDLITFSIENSDTEENYYRISISRYDYSEVFEGTLTPEVGEEDRLDFMISKKSKLVNCELLGGNKLRLGEYKLRGATIEERTPEMFIYSINKILSEDSTFPEFFLVPDKYKYIKSTKIELGKTHFDVYDKFLEFAKDRNCQFLIENKSFTDLFNIVEVEKLPNPTKEGTYYKIGDNYYDSNGDLVTDEWFLKMSIDGGDYSMNLCDTENRLVYFYRSLIVGFRQPRPGYYAFIQSIVFNEFSISRKDVYYDKEQNYDGFLDYSIEEILEKYKSNYMVCNNQTYYYKKYFSGVSPITTIWMRFVSGKIERELRKCQGEFIGQKLLGKINSRINDILKSIVDNFKIVESIEMIDFEPSGEELKVTIETYVNDLVDNHVTLDFTLNYNINEN